MPTKPKDLAAIGAALDEISYDWLSDYHPVLAEAIEAAVGRGADAQTIRRYVMAQTQRIELALRCEQAAQLPSSAVIAACKDAGICWRCGKLRTAPQDRL